MTPEDPRRHDERMNAVATFVRWLVLLSAWSLLMWAIFHVGLSRVA